MPVMVARGRQDGPVVGVTGAVHGNELNGVRVIHQLFRDIGGRELRGAVVGVPIVNVHGFVRHQRDCDGTDINRAMPGRENGPTPEV
ncbi:MAG: succinylglutamate desuccinylase/aspartoacylase family protein, partial [Myxococcales bacterium]|nr:succinylglutamate desuccinylase/aspartoacylase family protein [Myxococcales bacterium]